MDRHSFIYHEVLADPEAADDRLRFMGTMETFAEGDDSILPTAIQRLTDIAAAKQGLRCFVVGVGSEAERFVHRVPDVTIRREEDAHPEEVQAYPI